jgi:rare lipoprotein A
MYAMTAAHKTLPIPSYARVRNPANGAEVLVRVNDRGPFVAGRIVDLSYTAALKLGLLGGVAVVELESITFDDIRTGAWRRDAPGDPARAATTFAGVDTTPALPFVTAPIAVPVDRSADRMSAAPAPFTAVALDTDRSAAESGPPTASATTSTTAPVAATATTSSTTAPSLPAVADAPASRAYTTPARGFWVQLGAFRERGGAEDFQRRVMADLDWLSPLLAVFSDPSLFRLQAGPYPSRDEARGAAERIRAALRLVPLIVERR